MHGARLRQRQTGMQPKAFGRFVDGGQHIGIAALAVNDERRGNLTQPFDAVGRQPGQPQAQHALRG